MQYIAGLDGGGTKTRCVITTLRNSIVYETAGGSTNFLTQGTENACINILSILDECRNKMKISYLNFDKILIGTAGAGRKEDAVRLEKSFIDYCKRKQIKLKSFRVESDAVIALEGAFSGGPGCILIAGTGSIIYGKDDEGNFYRAGGFGRLIGDEGSGYSMGRKALQSVSHSFDGRSKPALLTDLFKKDFNIGSADDLIKSVYENKLDIASTAPLVIRAAEKGDSDALKIINEETDELLLLISSMLKKMDMRKVKLCLLGGLIDNDNFYSRVLKEKIEKKLKEAELHNPDYPPEMGAVFLAQNPKSNP